MLGGGSVSHIVCYYALASDRLLFIVVYTDALCVVLLPAVAGRVERSVFSFPRGAPGVDCSQSMVSSPGGLGFGGLWGLGRMSVPVGLGC